MPRETRSKRTRGAEAAKEAATGAKAATRSRAGERTRGTKGGAAAAGKSDGKKGGQGASNSALDLLASVTMSASQGEGDATPAAPAPAPEQAAAEPEAPAAPKEEPPAEAAAEDQAEEKDDGPQCVDKTADGDASDHCKGRMMACKKYDGQWRCKRHYDRYGARLRAEKQNNEEKDSPDSPDAQSVDQGEVEVGFAAYQQVPLMYGAPYAEAYAAAAAAAAQDPYASVAYYQMAADAASGAYAGAYMDVDPSAEIPVPEYEPQPEVATPAPRKAPKPRVKQQQQQQHAPITVRKNSVKAMCRPTAPEGHQPCEAIDVYGEWEAGSGRYRMPVRRVTVDGTTMQTVAGSEMRHLQGCSMIGVLFPTPGDLTCRSCGQTFSTTFNAASHGICRDNHFRCPPCDKSVTTLAAIQKHFKTPKHRQSTDGWTVDGEVKHKSVLERIHNEAVNVQAQRNNKDTGDD